MTGRESPDHTKTADYPLSGRYDLSCGSRKAGHLIPQRAHAYFPFMGQLTWRCSSRQMSLRTILAPQPLKSEWLRSTATPAAALKCRVATASSHADFHWCLGNSEDSKYSQSEHDSAGAPPANLSMPHGYASQFWSVQFPADWAFRDSLNL